MDNGHPTSGSVSDVDRTPLTPNRLLSGLFVSEPVTDTSTPGSLGTPSFEPNGFFFKKRSGSPEQNDSSKPTAEAAAGPQSPIGPPRKIGSTADMDEYGAVTIDATTVFSRLYDPEGNGRAKKKGAQVRSSVVGRVVGRQSPMADGLQSFDRAASIL